MKFSEMMKNRKKVKMNEVMKKAIVMGKKTWRKHLTSMQALSEVPILLQREIYELETIINSFYDEGGEMNYEKKETGEVVFTASFKDFKWTTVYKEEKEIYKAIEVFTNTQKIPKDVIERMGLVLMAFTEIPRRKHAQERLTELIAYLDDSNTKDSIEHALDTFGDNDMLMFNAVTDSNGNIFQIDVDKVVEAL